MSVRDSDRWTIRHLECPSRTDILLVAAHLPSQRDFDEVEDRLMGCTNLVYDNESCEKDIGHSRTVLVGDLNMNPFEAGVISAGGLHAEAMEKATKMKAEALGLCS